MLDGLLAKQIRDDAQMAGMLALYGGIPAFFYGKAPQDTDGGWHKPTFPHAVYSIDMRYDPERKTAGEMAVHVYSSTESKHMPEDIEKRLVELIGGTFYSVAGQAAVCAIWERSEAFVHETRDTIQGDTSPEVFGVTVLFGLLSFPPQLTTDPDPVQGLTHWTKVFFPAMKVISLDALPPVWKPSDTEPAIYWRFEGVAASDRQAYAVTWYTGEFAAHVIADSVEERNRWLKAIAEQIQLDGETVLADGSPMFAKQIKIRHDADPLREGQLLLTGLYGVLAQRRKEMAQPALHRAVAKHAQNGLEVVIHGRQQENP
jgi:hypothetical protein